MKKPPNTTVRHNTLWARVYIPADVRSHFAGQKLFLAKVGPWPMPYAEANAMAGVLVANWKRQIDSARSQHTGIDALLHGPDAAVDDAFELMPPDQLRSIARRLLAQLKIAPVATDAGSMRPDSPFLSHIEEWSTKTHLKGKTLDQALSDIKQFSAAVPASLAGLTGGMVQGWIESQAVSSATVRRKLSALRSYWQWLQGREYVPTDREPFAGRQVRDKRTKVEQTLDQRQRFEPCEVTRLIGAASGDAPLQALIRLAAFTGARREGLASLKKDSVVKVDGIRSLRVCEKTSAGVRDIPIHPAIADLVTKLAKESQDGFLIPSETNRYGQRGDSLGKRFTRLKTGLGFGEHHTFHSLRHTVVYLFRRAECPLEVRDQILGHENGNNGAGASYGGHIDQKQKLHWLERAIRY